MWFGDLVTMQWWDDLWLNEAFASWASNWAMARATEFSDQWASFLALYKRPAYEMDMGPGRHPIRGEVADVNGAMANFDAITYVKGQSVLHQLMAYIGEDAFVEGLRSYFRDHAFGNTVLDDLMSAYAARVGPRPVRLDRRVARPGGHRRPVAGRLHRARRVARRGQRPARTGSTSRLRPSTATT